MKSLLTWKERRLPRLFRKLSNHQNFHLKAEMFSFHSKYFVYRELKRAPQKLSFCFKCPDTGQNTVFCIYKCKQYTILNKNDEIDKPIYFYIFLFIHLALVSIDWSIKSITFKFELSIVIDLSNGFLISVLSIELVGYRPFQEPIPGHLH